MVHRQRPAEWRLEGRDLYKREAVRRNVFAPDPRPRDAYGRFVSGRRRSRQVRAARECLSLAVTMSLLAPFMGDGWLTVALAIGALWFWSGWLMLLPRRPRVHRGPSLVRVALAWAGRAVGRWAVRTAVRLGFVWPARLVVRAVVVALGVLGSLQLALTPGRRSSRPARTFTAVEDAQWAAWVEVAEGRRLEALARLEQLDAEQRAVRDTIAGMPAVLHTIDELALYGRDAVQEAIDVAPGVLTSLEELRLLFGTRRDHSAFARRLEGYWLSTLSGERRHDAECALEQHRRPEWAVDLLAAWAYRNQPMS